MIPSAAIIHLLVLAFRNINGKSLQYRNIDGKNLQTPKQFLIHDLDRAKRSTLSTSGCSGR